MTHSSKTTAPAPAPRRSTVDRRFDVFLSQLSLKARATIDKHLELCQTDTRLDQGHLWKRLAGDLGALAGHSTEPIGQFAIKFHIADGKYKQQTFALEDNRLGTIAVYLPDVLKLALERKLLSAGDAPNRYHVPGTDTQLEFETLTAQSEDITVYKAMVGWGRQALRVNLNVLAKETQIRAVEKLCQLAAEKWAPESSSPVNAVA
jgi:hypothetical protein